VAGVDLIVTALTAGAAAGITDTASNAIRDAYATLSQLVRRRLTDRGGQAVALDAEETDPAVWETRLRAELTGTGVDHDDQVLAAAQELLARLEAPATQYRVDLRDAKGVQVGDHNTQTNHF